MVDVSFISATKFLAPTPAPALALAAAESWLVILIKPQFEVGPEIVGKGGIVTDPVARNRAVASVRDWIAARPGWRVIDVVSSPIQGGDGNQEYLLGAVNDDCRDDGRQYV